MNLKTKEQESAYNKLSKLKVGALFMEMGTGKTKVALDLIASKANKIDYILWVCPYSLKAEIEAERLKWHPEINLKIVGCESIGSSDRVYLELIKEMSGKRCFMVVDESLKIKNRKAKRTERILELGKYTTYRLILNGTPLSKNVLDLWPQMQFLSPKILNMSYNEFKDTFCEYYIRGQLKGMVKRQYNIEYLISLIEPYIFDCKLDIKTQKHYYDIPYSMNNNERINYERVKTECINTFFDESNIDFFALSQRLQAFYTSAIDKEKKLEQVINELDDKVIVFVKYLKSIPEDDLKVIGSMSTEERSKTIAEFKNGPAKVLYITYGCGAYGLNLQFVKNIIFSEHTFDYAQREQAEARIYRLGQEYDVNYYSLWCDVGLERLIKGSLDKKSNLLDEVKKEIMKKGVKEWVKSI